MTLISTELNRHPGHFFTRSLFDIMWPNRTKPGTSRKTCFWVNSHKRWLAQNYFQIFKYVFSCLLSGERCIISNAWKNLFKWNIFSTINDGLSLLIPIHSCSKFLRSVVKQKYVDATYKISHILRSVYATNMILVTNDPCSGFCRGGSHIWYTSIPYKYT